MARLIKGIESKLIHAGEPEPLIGGAVTMPIFQSSTFESAGPEGLSRSALHPAEQHAQSHVLHRQAGGARKCRGRVGDWQRDGGDFLGPVHGVGGGGHLLAQDCLYGGTYDLFTRISRTTARRWISLMAMSRLRGAKCSVKTPGQSTSRRCRIHCSRSGFPRGSRVRRGEWAGLDHRQYLRESNQFPARRNRLRFVDS